MVYRPKGLRLLGVTQFVIGVLMIILAIASFAAYDYWVSYIGSGIWVGLWVGLTGLFAFLGAKSDNRPNNCLIGVMIGFAITACVEAGVMIIIYSIALGEIAERLRCPNYIDYRHGHGYNTYSYDHDNCYYYNRYSHYRRLTYSEAQVGAALCSLLLILAVLEFFVALASSIYGCNACCCSGPTVQTHQQVTYLQQPGGNVIVINPHGALPPGATLQTISTYQGQVLPVIQSAQPQTFVTSPQGIPQQGQPMQAFQTYPASGQAVGGAYSVQQPQQAFQASGGAKQGELPPPYNFNG